MIKHCACVALGLLLASPAAIAGDGPAAASSARAPVAHQVDHVHQQLHDQKAQTQKLRQRVDALQKQQQTDQQRIKQSNATIARLHQQLKQLDKQH